MNREHELKEINDHVRNAGVRKMPESAAWMLGESTPGWRHEYERQIDNRADQQSAKVRKAASIKAGILAKRGDVPRILHRIEPTTHSYLLCQFFDKVCVVCREPDIKQVRFAASRMSEKYGKVGARFFVRTGREVPPTWISWQVTMAPLLKRQLEKTENMNGSQ